MKWFEKAVEDYYREEDLMELEEFWEDYDNDYDNYLDDDCDENNEKINK